MTSENLKFIPTRDQHMPCLQLRVIRFFFSFLAIPSKPEQLNFTRLQNNQVLLMWNMPSNSHDHDDLRFKVKCNQKVVQGGSWDPCVNTSISEEGVYLTGTNLTVSRLLNNTHYNFTVFSMNNISEKLLKTSWSWSSILMNLSGNRYTINFYSLWELLHTIYRLDLLDNSYKVHGKVWVLGFRVF